MKYRQFNFFQYIIIMVSAIVALNVTYYAQSVAISHTGGATQNAPATFTVTATPSVSVQKVVFYRNDVPVYSDSTSPYSLPQVSVGQETYTYRARAYISSTSVVDSPNITVTVRTPLVLRMGGPFPTPQPSPSPTPLKGPDRYYDHTNDIRRAIQYLSDNGGGTLVFPCSGGTYPGNVPDPQSIYNISETIVIPDNITLQSESAEASEGRCRIYWRDPTWEPDYLPIEPAPADSCYDNDNPQHNPNTADLLHKPMFQINGGTKGVRFRDLFLYSRSSGPNCHERQDYQRIAIEETTGIALFGYTGDINDLIIENVSILNFTWGIKASTCVPGTGDTCNETENKINDIRMRGVRPMGNHRQLYIDSKYAYDWDIQNFNIGFLGPDQGGIEIIRSGRPADYSGENGKIKFLQLNCQGNAARTPAFCVDIKKHGGLYFKNLHTEGVSLGLGVNDIGSATNNFPIVMEGSGASGRFYDDSMKLYLVGNGILAAPEGNASGQDNSRLEFYGNGVNSTVVDCGDLHWDRTDTVPSTLPEWGDWKMQYTHSERNRASFYIPLAGYDLDKLHLDKPHKVCPQGVSGYPNTSEIGGEFFDSGVLPVEPDVYALSQIFTSSDCGFDNDCGNELQNFLDQPYDGRTLVIKGVIPVNQTVTLPSGTNRARQIVGIKDNFENAPQINFTPASGIPLFKIDAPIPAVGHRTSGVTIRDLKMVQTNNQTGTYGIRIIGGNDSSNPNIVGLLSDTHLSGLTIQGFETGFYAGHNGSYASPMLDGVSLKNFSFINNSTSARLDSQNASNWNIINLSMVSSSNNAEGWDQKYGGSSLQNVTCAGSTSHDMKDCVRLEMSHVAVTGLKKTQYVTNVVTIREGSYVNYMDPVYQAFQTSHLLIRHSDLTTGNYQKYSLNLLGKAFIVSMNNKYDYFPPKSSYYERELSRVTSCGDTGGTFSVLETLAHNNYVGLDTPTLMTCGSNPIAWEDPIKWGEDGDIPLVGNFYHNVKEDHVVYRPGSSAKFLIREAQGTRKMEDISWGTTYDKPVVGRFFANTQKSQIGIFRPSNGQWWLYDPNTTASTVVGWGISEDIPIVGNFFSEGSNPVDQRDEIAVYRPSTKAFWIINPRTGYNETHSRTVDYGANFQIGDFLNLGYEQVAQFQNNNWYIKDLDTGTEYSPISFGATGDIAVAGKYFDQGCTQLGIWSPSLQKFQVKDPQNTCSTSGIREGSVNWGLSYGSSDPDDLPLVMKGENGLDRPTALRRINKDPKFEFFVTKHLWWVHDPITPNP